MTKEAYQAALAALQSTISGKTRSAPKTKNELTWDEQFERLQLYLDRLGMTDDLDKLSVIHVAGTKGKGSTCAFVEHILRENNVKTGLYSSPHLVDVRERFRVNGAPVSKQTFTKEFWWLFNGCKTKCKDLGGAPAYFRFLTLLGFRIFEQEKVGCAILEVGLGGRLDATNLVRHPTVCGVTSLGMDHVEVLGDTIAKIATEKAGIFKPRVPAFTSPQPFDAMEALQVRADYVGAKLDTAPPLRSYSRDASGPNADDIKLGLAGQHQKLNAALAVRLVREWAFQTRPAWGPAVERDLSSGELPETFRAGLAKTQWWGRAQVVADTFEGLTDENNDSTDTKESDSSLVWYLDGAHTEESMAQCAEWFCEASKWPEGEETVIETMTETATQTEGETANDATQDTQADAAVDGDSVLQEDLKLKPPPPQPLRLFLFNCMEERDPLTLLTPLAKALSDRKTPLTHPAYFAPSESSAKGLVPDTQEHVDLRWQQKMAGTWDDLVRKHPGSYISSEGDAGVVPENAPAAGDSNTPPIPTSLAASVPSLRLAVEKIRSVALEQRRLRTGRRVHVLVAGSLYLVGDMLRVLGRA